MECLQESRVDPADIDNLGHMNVRVYARKAAEATRALAGLLGIAGDHTQIFDSHVHFRREQLEGAPLLIHGGVAEASQDTITAYLEMTNADNGDLAATFLNVFRVIDPPTRNGEIMPASALDASGAHQISVPDHGKLAPWRFELWPIGVRQKVHDQLQERLYAATDIDDVEKKAQGTAKLLHAPCVLVAISTAAEHPKIPIWEQHLSTGAACMNTLIAANSLGFEAQWLTAWYIYRNDCRDILGLAPDEQIAGIIHIGTNKAPKTDRPRPDIDSLYSIRES